jgi:murein DD-endopeptidase MepM/ murein hydrolase activator NlpD
MLNDPERQLAIAPPPRAEPREVPTGEGGPLPEEVDPVALTTDLDRLDREVVKEEKTLSALRDYFADQKQLLAAAPSIWPVRGWVTSDFGARLDPYTEERTLHQGLDIATAKGTPVKAPADGVVIFGGYEGPGYGNVIVIDHGYGVKTRHGHLEDVFVKVGEKVKRGHVIGAVGNTGRSTGPHLHYEVRINGIPENPRKYILQE